MQLYPIPFLTRFFLAWADDIRIPKTEPPVPEKGREERQRPDGPTEDS